MRSYSTSPPVPAREVIQKLLHIKALWLIGLTLMFRMACITGVMGYLPLYLRQQGWAVANADGVVAGFYAISTLSVIPLSMLSDRIGSRKAILSVALVIALLGLALIPVVDDTGVWILVLAVGIFMDAFMALSLTMAQETRGVAPGYSGTALGLVFTLSNIGAFASPPLGNSLADIDAGMPLLFWASLSLAAIITLIFIRETRQKAGPALPPKS